MPLPAYRAAVGPVALDAHLDAITARVISGQDELVELLRAGQVDLGEDLQPYYLDELEMEPALRLYKFMDDSYDFLGFQLGDPEDPQPRLNEDGTLNEVLNGFFTDGQPVRPEAALAYLPSGAGAASDKPVLTKIEHGKKAPLSYSQQQMWVLDQLNPGSVSYTVPNVMHFNTPVDPAALDEAMGHLDRQRHEAVGFIAGKSEHHPLVASSLLWRAAASCSRRRFCKRGGVTASRRS